MCEKKLYCGTRIDPCLQSEIDHINKMGELKTLSCCCGHGKYPKTIVVKHVQTGRVYEYYTEKLLAESIRKNHRYYKKDSEGYYYIPELTEMKQ